MNDDEKKSITIILRQLEEMSLDVEQGFITERYVYKTLKTFLQRFFLISYKQINIYREDGNSDTFEKNYEILMLRQHFYKKFLFEKIINGLFYRSGFDFSGVVFSAHFRTSGKSFYSFLKEILSGKSLPKKITYLDDLQKFDELKLEYESRIGIANFIEVIFLAIILLSFLSLFLG